MLAIAPMPVGVRLTLGACESPWPRRLQFDEQHVPWAQPLGRDIDRLGGEPPLCAVTGLDRLFTGRYATSDAWSSGEGPDS